MRVLFVLLILLGFPVLEAYTLFQVAEVIGWWLALWLILSAVAGWMLIQEERFAVLGRLMASMQTGGSPFGALLESARMLIAGILLIFPGVLSDFLAVVLLLLPRRFAAPKAAAAANDGTIEGEWVRVESEHLISRPKRSE